MPMSSYYECQDRTHHSQALFSDSTMLDVRRIATIEVLF
jgi:hypothetical protein